MMTIKKIFLALTYKIPEVRNENYWKCLHILRMYSQEWRMERYIMIYVWKIPEGLASNSGVELCEFNETLGRRCKVPSLARNGRQAIQTLREQSLHINGVGLFNCLPKRFREIKQDIEKFKSELDKYLSTIVDKPRI